MRKSLTPWRRRLAPAAVRAALLGLTLVCLIAGCQEEAAESAPEDIEKARQEHINMTQREMGQGG